MKSRRSGLFLLSALLVSVAVGYLYEHRSEAAAGLTGFYDAFLDSTGHVVTVSKANPLPIDINGKAFDGTEGPDTGYPAIGTCSRLVANANNTQTSSGAIAAGRYVITPTSTLWFMPKLAGSTAVTTSTGFRMGDVPGEHIQISVDGSTQNRFAIITSTGLAILNYCAETY